MRTNLKGIYTIKNSKYVVKCGDKYIGTFENIDLAKKARNDAYNQRYGVDEWVNKRVRHNMSKTKTYKTWQDMISRCYNPKKKFYYLYGGRGIGVCDRWRESFLNFLEDMGVKPNGNYSIDRINADEGYSKENCRWATAKTQVQNRRLTKLKYRGVYKTKNKTYKFTSIITINGKNINLGVFKTDTEAYNTFLSTYKEWYGFYPKYTSIIG